MFDGAIILADLYDPARPPRIIAPLQHLFEPVMGTPDVYSPAARWGAAPVPLSGFSDCPRIVFDRPAALPENLAEAMLYHLQLRLMDPALHIRHNLPTFTFGRSAHPALDEGVRLLQ